MSLGGMNMRSSVVLVAAVLASTAVTFGTANAADDWENSPVRAKWQALGGASFAGDKVGDEVVEPGGTRWAKFSKYDIVITWRESAGAHWMSGAITGRWLSGGRGSVLLKDQVAVSRGAQAGAAADFEFGSSIYYSDAYGAFWVHGTERDTYLGNGGATGKFGWPTSDLFLVGPVGSGKFEQQFSEAVSTYREPERSATWMSGALRDKFREELAAGSRDWPAQSQIARPGNGWSVRMNRGAIYWSAATGAHKLDWMYDTYETEGGPGGRFGYPVTDTRAHDGGFSTDFVNQTTLYRGPADENNNFWISGRVRDEYGVQGGPAGPLGWPRSSQTPAPGTDGVYVLFGDARDKVILWGPRTGGHVVRGQFLEKLRAGGDVAVYGLPQYGEMRVGDYDFQQFENASVFVGNGRVVALGWDFRAVWWQTGGTQSPLGMPKYDAQLVPGQTDKYSQVFDNGWVHCDYGVGECSWGLWTSEPANAPVKPEQGTKFRATTSGPRG
jgi:uncharacterized protein with LGFP repeats